MENFVPKFIIYTSIRSPFLPTYEIPHFNINPESLRFRYTLTRCGYGTNRILRKPTLLRMKQNRILLYFVFARKRSIFIKWNQMSFFINLTDIHSDIHNISECKLNNNTIQNPIKLALKH